VRDFISNCHEPALEEPYVQYTVFDLIKIQVALYLYGFYALAISCQISAELYGDRAALLHFNEATVFGRPLKILRAIVMQSSS
jgi:hypothetical protein